MTARKAGSFEADARAILADSFGCAPEEVPLNARLGYPAAWDSIGHMRVVMAIEERIGRMLSADEIGGIERIEDVTKLVGRGTAGSKRLTIEG